MHRLLSSAIMNGGMHQSDTVVIKQVMKGYDHVSPENDLRKTVSALGLPEHTVGLMTAAFLPKALTHRVDSYGHVKVATVVSAGVCNAVVAGELIPNVEGRVKEKIYRAGTINMVCVLDRPLSDEGLVNAIMTMSEAKAAGLRDEGIDGTGTTSDAIVLATPFGDGARYAGTATEEGICLSRSIRAALASSIRGNGDRPRQRDLLELLEEEGVSRDDLWQVALGLYVPCPSWEIEDLRSRFMARLDLYRDDVNVNAMVAAAVLLEREGRLGRLAVLDAEGFASDPVHLVADEMLGLQLSEYIAGTRGMFEFTRYDRKKPGVLSRLGPFLDDIVASLVGGIMSAIYTELLEGDR